uniref:Uncharacterized protein n=1 Tax=Arundo donax TaxID=35708 RepID=A0A0A9GAM7_ARUDO
MLSDSKWRQLQQDSNKSVSSSAQLIFGHSFVGVYMVSVSFYLTWALFLLFVLVGS